MKQFQSFFTGYPIYFEAVQLGRIHGFIVDPANGNLLAVTLDFSGNQIIPMEYLLFFFDRFFVNDRDCVFEQGDILKISEILEDGLNLQSQKVISRDEEYLGRLVDFEIDLTFGEVKKLLVRKRKFLFFTEERLINIKDVAEVTAEVIFLDIDFLEKIPKKKAVPVLDTA